jgi:hypothetical protein
MIDMTQTIAAKSDQLNADDLIGGGRTIEITDVSLASGEQPIAISFKGDGGKPFLPCKTVRRILVAVWGADGSKYKGKSMTIYRDASVTFGGANVGGIRVSHMSHMDEAVTLHLTATKKSKKPVTIRPLETVNDEIDVDALKAESLAVAANGMDALRVWWKEIGAKKQKLLNLPELKKIAENTNDFEDEELPL